MRDQTEDFIITVPDVGPVEVWVDWVLAADGVPGQPIVARWQGDNLLVTVPGDLDESGSPRPGREVVGIDPKFRSALDANGLLWVVCGPSGVLGRSATLLEH